MSQEKESVETTITKKTSKHHKLKVHIELNSTPLDLDIESPDATTTITNKQRNFSKYSFGKVAFLNCTVEGFTYLTSKKSDYPVFLSCTKHIEAKTALLQMDKRRSCELYSLQSKIRYFQALTAERKLEYLRNHGVFAHINMGRDNT